MTSTTSNYTRESTSKKTGSNRWLRVAGVVAAVVVALVIWAIGGAAGAEYLVPAWDGSQDRVGAVDVVVMAAALPLLGWALLAVLERFTNRAVRVWTVIAVAVTGLSIVPIALMTGSQAPATTTVPLMLIHLAVGATVIAFFRRSHR